MTVSAPEAESSQDLSNPEDAYTPPGLISESTIYAPYRISADDELGISVLDPVGEDLRPYRIGPFDELEVSIHDDTTLSRTQTVRPDGRIAVPLVGDIQAAGRTPEEVRTKITERLKERFQDPDVTVIVTDFQSRSMDLDRTQKVRPDGRIAFPLVGEIQAEGLTPEELADQIARGLKRYFREPQVTVLVTGFQSRTVSVLGEVREPGTYEFGAKTRLLDALATAGGFTEDANLDRTLVVREGKVLPLNFSRLIRYADVSQNIVLRANDTVVVPSGAPRALVLGWVGKPQAVPLSENTTVLDSITNAGGFKEEAEKGSILVVRGGLENPELFQVNAKEILTEGDVSQNIALQNGDIVYVSRTQWKSTVAFFSDLSKILSALLQASTAIILAPDVWSVLTTGESKANASIAIPLQ